MLHQAHQGHLPQDVPRVSVPFACVAVVCDTAAMPSRIPPARRAVASVPSSKQDPCCHTVAAADAARCAHVSFARLRLLLVFRYRVYMKAPDGGRDLFLMCGKKRSGQKTSNYLISMSEDDLRRKSSNYLGKLRANFVGTEFRIYDNGCEPQAQGTNHSRQRNPLT